VKAAFAIILFGALTAFGQPAQVILLRHGEKPPSAEAADLSPRGRDRAQALVSLLGHASSIASNAPVAALYATRVTRRDRSHRTGETLEPLAKDLNLPIHTPFGSDDYARLAASVLNEPAHRDKTVIVCWTHHDLAQLAGAFGVKPRPPAWKDSVFDRLWRITFSSGNAQLIDLPQHLLKGDSTR
jgi:hypothetical protein